jgi:hypothetical protein
MATVDLADLADSTEAPAVTGLTNRSPASLEMVQAGVAAVLEVAQSITRELAAEVVMAQPET